MNRNVEKTLQELPDAPGVYSFYSDNDILIYVGKSKRLKRRVRSYFTPSRRWEKALRMRPFIRRIDYRVTDTHLEAELLEMHRIFYEQPLFNNRMKSDRRLSYLLFDDERRIIRTAKIPSENTLGPVGSSRRTYRLLEEIRHILPIGADGSFEYRILTEGLNKEERTNSYAYLKKALQNKKAFDVFLAEVEERMERASRDLAFETARFYRDLADLLRPVGRFLEQRDLFSEREIFLSFPLKTGNKLIRISDGRYVAGGIYREENEKEALAKRLLAMSPILPPRKIDKYHRDIVFREMTRLPEDRIFYLKKRSI